MHTSDVILEFWAQRFFFASVESLAVMHYEERVSIQVCNVHWNLKLTTIINYTSMRPCTESVEARGAERRDDWSPFVLSLLFAIKFNVIYSVHACVLPVKNIIQDI